MTRFRPFFSLRVRLILLVLLALVPALAIMLYTAAETRQREAARVDDEALTLARLLSANQESTIEGARQLLIAVAQIRDVQSGDPAVCSARLVELLKLYPDYNGFGVVRPDGEVFCSTAPLAQPINASNRAWFQRAIQTRNFAVGDYQVGRTSGRAILVFSYPLLDAAGQLQAVVFAVIELDILNQLAAEIPLPEGAALIEIDRNGTVLDYFPNPEAWIGQALPEAPLVQAMLNQGEGVVEMEGLDGVARLYAFTPLRNPMETGLYLAFGIPHEVAFAEADQTLVRNLTWLGLVGLLALLAAWFGGEVFILRRVKTLVNATERLRNGDLSARTGLSNKRGGELGYLAHAFDDMAATLEQREAERKQAEEVIREQREWLRVTLSSIGDAVITTNLQGQVTFMNPVAQTLTGWSEVAAIGQPLEEVFHIYNETTRAMVENPVTKVIREGMVVGLANHTLLLARDGREIPIDDSGAPIRDEADQINGVVLVFRDITERKQAEKALEEGRRRLQALFDNTLDAILLADDEAHFVDANPAACALLGYNREELLQLSTWEITPGGYRELGQELWQAFIRNRQQGGEYTVLRKDGTTVEADYRAVANIVPGLHLSVLRDITERKKARQALEAQRVFLRQVIDINPNFIFAKDQEGRFTLVNQAVAEAYGSTVAELVGKTDADFNPNPAEVEHFQRDDLEVINSLQEKFIPEEVITDATGKVRWLQTVKRPLVGPNGLADQLLGVATDITERKRIEEELRLSRDQLTIILQGVADGITVQDGAGRLIYANDAAARITGYPSAQAILEAPLQELMQKFKVLDEAGQPFPLAQLPGRLALQGEPTPSATIRFQGVATGEEYWSYVKARPVFDEQGQVKLAVNIFQDITELKRSEQSQRFLAEASTLLSSSLNYEITLASIANLAVPRMADWCAVDVLQKDETVQRLAVAHVDPAKVELAHELQRRYPPDWDAPTGVPNVLRTGQSEFYPEITDAMLEAGARDAEHLQMARELQLRSAMVVPLKARGRTLGAMTFVWAESGHHYDENDLALAEELAHRAAIAVDNAQLYQEAQRLNTELEQRVIKRTAELQAANKKLESEIAERKRAEAQLRQEKEFSESLINSSFDGILAFDRDCRYTVWNPAMERLTGVSKAETLAKNAFEVFPFLREIGEDKYFFQALAGQIAAVEDRPYQVPQTGQQGFFEGHYSPIQDVSGQVVGGLGVIRDITQRKNMEAELDEIQHRLVESRERDRLQLGRELHDGPIQDLYGVAFGLEAFKETLDQVSLAQFRVVQTTMWQVISTLRFISSELRPQTLTPFGLEKAILSHVERFQETHPELQVKLDLMPDGQILPEGMRLTLFRIYQELLNNAAQHARARQVWIRFTLDSEQAVLEVQDDGRGFETPQRWIELARQGQLGLVETLERAEAIGGQMKVVSAPGEGALIRVTVPRPTGKESW